MFLKMAATDSLTCLSSSGPRRPCPTRIRFSAATPKTSGFRKMSIAGHVVITSKEHPGASTLFCCGVSSAPCPPRLPVRTAQKPSTATPATSAARLPRMPRWPPTARCKCVWDFADRIGGTSSSSSSWSEAGISSLDVVIEAGIAAAGRGEGRLVRG